MSSPRSIFKSLAQMPPALMLLIIIGLAVLVTMMVTGRMSQEEQALKAESGETMSSSESAAPVIVSIDRIPGGSTITKQMVAQRRLAEKSIWEDAITTTPNAVGRVTKHSIPAYTQIREEDLK